MGRTTRGPTGAAAPVATLAALRAYAVAHSLFAPTSLPGALRRMGFVQADPIRAPSRAQDLILRHRVKRYRDGDLERRYARLGIEEDALHNYGFVTRELQALLHPRTLLRSTRVERSHPELVAPILEFVRTRGPTHPRDLDAHHGGRSVTNYWGGNSAAATHMLDTLHYRGQLRVVRRDSGIRVYEIANHHPSAGAGPAPRERAGRLISRLVDLYAPIPEPSLRQLVMMLRYGAPGLEPVLRERSVVRDAVADQHVAMLSVDAGNWLVPVGARIAGAPPKVARLLAPFDPVVWDRRRFEIFWGWRYRFEAYTPASRRVLGYYALPLLYGDAVIGWANARVDEARLEMAIGFASTRPRDRSFVPALDEEVERLREFLGAERIARLKFLR